MKIFATGDARRLSELKTKLGFHGETAIYSEELTDVNQDSLKGFDLVFDLNLDDHPEHLRHYEFLQEKLIIAGAVKNSLLRAVAKSGASMKSSMVGINALPTFINRPKVEMSFVGEGDQQSCLKIINELGWEVLPVQDRTGMVTPRVITMIINEACFTLQEGTASKEDIDKAMKLGTNYPYGPFEWCDLIGIKDVYETLDAILNDTHDARYMICPLLKNMYLKNKSFY